MEKPAHFPHGEHVAHQLTVIRHIALHLLRSYRFMTIPHLTLQCNTRMGEAGEYDSNVAGLLHRGGNGKLMAVC